MPFIYVVFIKTEQALKTLCVRSNGKNEAEIYNFLLKIIGRVDAIFCEIYI